MRRWLIAVPLVFILLLGFLLVVFNSGVLQHSIEKKASEALGGPVKLGHVSLVPMWPLAVQVGASSVSHPAFTLNWKSLRVELRNFLPPFKVRVKVDEPILVALPPPAKTPVPPEPVEPSGESPAAAIPPLHLTVIVRGGDLKYANYHIRDLETDFEQSRVLESPARLNLKARVEGLMVPVSISIESEDLTLTPERVASSNFKFAVAGLVSSLQGSSSLKEGVHRWQAKIDAPDLSRLPQLPLPATGWKGSVQLDVLVEKNGSKSDWAAKGEARADKVWANLALMQPKLSAKGPFHLDLRAKFSYGAGAVSVPQLETAADFTQTEIIYENMLNKAAGIPLSFSSQIDGDQSQIQFRDLQFNFWKMSAKASGQVATRSPFAATLKVNVPSFALEGAEKILTPLSKQPVRGEIALAANFDGSLMEPVKAKLNVESLKLKNIFADVAYEKPGVAKISGPMQANVEARFQVAGGAVKQADAKGRVILSDMTLYAKPLHKEAKQALLADFQIRNTGEVFDVQNFSLESFAGRIKVSGRISGIFDPKLQLRGEVQSLNLSELRMALPDYRDKIPKGQVNGTISLSGQRSTTKPWNDWPMLVAGDLRVQLPEYMLSPSPPEKSPEEKEGANQNLAPPPEPFLPAGELTSRMNLKVAADIGILRKDKLDIKGVHVSGNISGGRFRGGAKIEKIFSGGLQVSNLDVPLLDSLAPIQGSVRWRDWVIEDALEFAKPSAKEFASGRMAGNADFLTKMPGDKEFKRALKASGAISLEPVTLNSVKIGEMINDVVKKIPMLKLQPVKVEPMKGSINSDFDYKNETLQIEKLTAIDQDQSELQLKGKVVVPTMHGDFVGSFMWAKPQIQGCLLEGNSDAKGRMVIPVAIKGDLMHPGFSTLSDLVGKLGGRALECEKKKLVEKFTRDGGKQLEGELKKHLKGLFGN